MFICSKIKTTNLINPTTVTLFSCIFAVTLARPQISLPTLPGLMVHSPEKISVKQGSSISVICSTVSKYRDGYFYLTQLNRNDSYLVKPACNLSAIYGSMFDNYGSTFNLPAIEKTHEGVYTCIHAVNFYSTPFDSAPSKPLQVVVKEN